MWVMMCALQWERGIADIDAALRGDFEVALDNISQVAIGEEVIQCSIAQRL
jgi:hypothetical protein